MNACSRCSHSIQTRASPSSQVSTEAGSCVCFKLEETRPSLFVLLRLESLYPSPLLRPMECCGSSKGTRAPIGTLATTTLAALRGGSSFRLVADVASHPRGQPASLGGRYRRTCGRRKVR